MKIDCLMIGKKSKTNQVWHVVIVKVVLMPVNAFSDNVEQYAVAKGIERDCVAIECLIIG